MNRDWTIDTWVLYEFSRYNDMAIEFIPAIKRKDHSIVIDSEGKIEGEYYRCFKKISCESSIALKKWYKHISKRIFSNALSRKCQKKLKDLEFDNDDRPFVSVCSKSSNKILVAEESDYNEKVKSYLFNEMKIKVLTVKDALEICDNSDL